MGVCLAHARSSINTSQLPFPQLRLSWLLDSEWEALLTFVTVHVQSRQSSALLSDFPPGTRKMFATAIQHRCYSTVSKLASPRMQPSHSIKATSITGMKRSQAGPLCATQGESKASAVTGIVFQPFIEVEPQVQQLDEMLTLPPADVSYARTGWVDRAELAINEQINVELNIFYVYQSMYAYFDRDNVGLPGFAAFFRTQSDEELSHARILMNYQNNRGGRVRLGTLLPPQIDYQHDAKGDALFATELALSLEKLNFRKLWALVNVANEVNDVQLADFIETYLLEDQMKDIKQQAALVSQLRRVGLGHGVYHVDLELQREYGKEVSELTRNLNAGDGVGRGNGAEGA